LAGDPAVRAQRDESNGLVKASKNLLFLKEKKQKNFILLFMVARSCLVLPTSGRFRVASGGAVAPGKSFLLLFFKKEDLACLCGE